MTAPPRPRARHPARASGRSPSANERAGEDAVVGQPGPAGRRPQGGEPLQPLQRIEEQRGRAVGAVSAIVGDPRGPRCHGHGMLDIRSPGSGDRPLETRDAREGRRAG
jgi:hypothetical protein